MVRSSRAKSAGYVGGIVKYVLLPVVVCAIVFLAKYTKYLERRSIFFPARDIDGTPKDVKLSYDNVFFSARDRKKLNGWFIYNYDLPYVVLYCHGNAGNISHRFDKLTLFNKLGLKVFIFDYRGYGKSQGVPSEKGLYLDVEAAYYHLVEERMIPPENIIIYGSSIGGAVAIDLASKVKSHVLIVEGTFTKIKDMLKVAYPFVPAFLISSKFDSFSKISSVKQPVLVIHSREDEIVPFWMGEKLFHMAHPPKKMLTLKGGHNTAFHDSEVLYGESIKSFIRYAETLKA